MILFRLVFGILVALQASAMPDLKDTFARHSRYQDAMVQAFETHLREIVLRAQAQVLAQLQQKLSITDGTIDATPANMRVMRNAGPLFMDEMRRQGYDRLVEAFAGEFRGTLPFLKETIQQLGEQVQKKWPDLGFTAKDLNLLAATQANAAVSIEAAVESVAGAAMTRGLFSVAGLRFGELAEMLTEKFETSIGKARTIADTSMSTFYATATDRAFQIIEKDLPEQVQHYKYSGPDDKLTRPFCEHLLNLGKAYTREEIGKMDNGQLPNVMITRGGFNCRHQWIIDISQVGRSEPSEADLAAFTRELHSLRGNDLLTLGDINPQILRRFGAAAGKNTSSVLTARQRAHYLDRHPEMAKIEPWIRAAVTDPDLVYRNATDPNMAIFYRSLGNGRYLRVAVLIQQDPATGLSHSVLSARKAYEKEIQRFQLRVAWKRS